MKEELTTDLSRAWLSIPDSDLQPCWMVRGMVKLIYDDNAPCWLQFMVCELRFMTQVTSSVDLLLETK